MSDTLTQIETIFKDLFDDEDLNITMETTAEDIEDWDSITNIHLLVMIEKHFDIIFTSLEIHQFKNVGEIVNRISQK